MTYLGWWPGMEMLPRHDAFDDERDEGVYVHIRERTEPRDESQVCPLCGWHRDDHDDGDCPPAEMSGIEAAQRMQRATPWSLAMCAQAEDAGQDPVPHEGG